MGRGKLSAKEIQILAQNPNVYEVDEYRIVYTEAFKQHFMQEYLSGKRPTGIFREAGFSTEILGSKRIERSTARWKEAYYAGSLGKYKDVFVQHAERLHMPGITDKEKEKITAENARRKLREKQRQINTLRAENEALKEQLRVLKGQIEQKENI